MKPPQAATPQYPMPSLESIKWGQAWVIRPNGWPSIQRMAHHEAGHVVFMELLGLDGITAEATETSGVVRLPKIDFSKVEVPADPHGHLLGCAVALYHAGLMAELLYAGEAWTGPVFYPEQTDHQVAEMMLASQFGHHHSGAHAYAQRVALHFLSENWSRVCEVASVLEATGKWSSEPGPLAHQPLELQ